MYFILWPAVFRFSDSWNGLAGALNVSKQLYRKYKCTNTHNGMWCVFAVRNRCGVLKFNDITMLLGSSAKPNNQMNHFRVSNQYTASNLIVLLSSVPVIWEFNEKISWRTFLNCLFGVPIQKQWQSNQFCTLSKHEAIAKACKESSYFASIYLRTFEECRMCLWIFVCDNARMIFKISQFTETKPPPP